YLPLGEPLKIDDSSYLHNLFRMVAIEHETAGDYKSLIIRSLLQIIFYKLLDSNQPVKASVIISDIYELRREIMSKPEMSWNINMMAEKLNISPGYLETSYKAAFGVSCMEDVIRSRV